jgi:GAF domain-containing protein
MPAHPARRDIGAILAEFASQMAEQRSPEEILEQLTDYCTELLPVHGAGILLREGDDLRVGTANTEAGRVVEGLEADLGEGPCTDALRSGEQVVVPDPRPRWTATRASRPRRWTQESGRCTACR